MLPGSIRGLAVLTVSICTLSLSCAAQQTLSPEAAVGEALARNPSLAVARAHVDAARAGSLLAHAQARRAWSLTGGTAATEGQNIDPDFWYGYGEISAALTRRIADGGKAQAEALIADAELVATERDYDQQAADLEFEVSSAYYRLLLAEAEAATAADSLQLIADHLRRAQARASEGDAPQLDVLRAQTALAAAQADEAEAAAASFGCEGKAQEQRDALGERVRGSENDVAVDDVRAAPPHVRFVRVTWKPRVSASPK